MSRMADWRIGLGPVFAYERIAGSRRWQGYALRSLFARALLVALLCVWASSVQATTVSSIRYLAVLGKGFFLAVVDTELALVILAAPAATAGAICLDRARGTLSHMLMTDLSGAEIVLGKLGSRLLPVLSILVCALPILELLTLLGGVDPTALLTGFVVAASVAVLWQLAGDLSLAVDEEDARGPAHDLRFALGVASDLAEYRAGGESDRLVVDHPLPSDRSVLHGTGSVLAAGCSGACVSISISPE